ncbi:J domain-containing protein [Glaciihabitans sp. UYNi722]|uniref:J domain-containing protein n=1 Tax=Glaciihabitans sp. UYNi722 TaxID=3156344 RepID=UPI003395561E
MEPPSHYELLCVTPEATADEIRTAYRRLIRIYHPDVAGAAGAAMTLRLNEAQNALLDPVLRSQFDERMRARRQRPSPAGRAAYATFRSEWRPEPPKPAPAAARAAASTTESGLPWLVAFTVAAALIVAATIVVFVFCYSGPLTLTTPRLIPALVIGLAWVVGGFNRPPKIFIALLAFGALLWPLSTAQIGLFSTTVVPGSIWALLTVVALAVLVLRLAAARLSRPRVSSTA